MKININNNYGMNQNSNILNSNNQMHKSNDNVKRKKDLQVPAKPPPTLPKPKFVIPQSSTTSLILQRNLKSKSELNIATPSSISSSSASASSTSSNLSNNNNLKNNNFNAELNNNNPTISQNPVRNKILENSSLVSSSQGYHSDTWDSHSSRQSFDMDLQPANSSNKYKQFNKISSKMAMESKLAKTSVLPNNISANENLIINGEVNGSDGSINGIVSSDDTDSIQNMNDLNEKNQQGHIYPKNVQANSSSTSSTVSTSSNVSTSATSAATISGATSLSSNCTNNFSSGIGAINQRNNAIATASTSSTTSNSSSIDSINDNNFNNKIKISNDNDIELPIYYQPSDANDEVFINEEQNNYKALNKSISKNNINCDIINSIQNYSANSYISNTINASKNQNTFSDLYVFFI